MAWATTGDLDAFLQAAGGFLRSRTAEHTLLLTVSESLRVRGPHAYGMAAPRFGWWEDGEEVGGAFLQTPPHPMLLTALPDEAGPALADLLGSDPPASLNGPAGHAEAVAERLGGSEVRRRERLYRLGTLTPPDPAPPGRAVLAGRRQRGVMSTWYAAFEAEANEPEPPADATAVIDDRLSHDGLHVWELDDGAPVAMAGLTRSVHGMVRVNLVYTPPERRRQGFGAAVTAAATRAALDSGVAEVLLFTDLANPTTNRIYQQIGYRPVADRVSLRLAPRAG